MTRTQTSFDKWKLVQKYHKPLSRLTSWINVDTYENVYLKSWHPLMEVVEKIAYQNDESIDITMNLLSRFYHGSEENPGLRDKIEVYQAVAKYLSR